MTVSAKPFYLTSEFWAVVATVVGNVAAAIADKLPARYASIASAVAVAAYALGRSIVKRPTAIVQPAAAAPPPAS